MPEKELTGAQIDRQDCVDSAIHALLNDLAMGQEIEWDMEFIGDVREAVQDVICDRLKLMTEMEFYPYVPCEAAIILTKCMVAATNANGEPDFYFVIVESTAEEYDLGLHYKAARKKAEEEGYEPKLVFDQNDAGGAAILGNFAWESASTITVSTYID